MAVKKEEANSVDILKEDIKSGRIRNIYLFYGPEEYLKRYYLESVEKALLQEELKSLNKVTLEGKVDARKLSEYCDIMPIFSQKKVVLVKNSNLFKAKKKSEGEEGKPKGDKDDLPAYLLSIPEYTCLIFYEEEIDKRLKVIEAIKKRGLIVEFPYQKPLELTKWVVKAFKSNKKEIDQVIASQLVEASEQGMTEILNEINKVITYLGARTKVTGEDIEKICSKSVKSRIFDLTDAVAERNVSKAVKLLDDMVLLKEPLPKILYMMTRQFRQILEMKLLRGEGLNAGETAKRMGISPYAAGKVATQAGSFTIDRLKEAIRECLDMDIAIKTGKIHDRLAAEILIAGFAGEE